MAPPNRKLYLDAAQRSLTALRSAIPQIKMEGRLDAAETVFFIRELSQLLAENFDIKYAKLKTLELLPVDGSVDPGSESVRYRQFDSAGSAKRLASLADDFPMVNVKGSEYEQRMQSYGAAFMYDVDEIRAAAKAGRPLEADRAQAVRKKLAQQLDDIGSLGDSVAGLTGLLNLSNTDTYTPASINASKHWQANDLTANKTPDQILADLNGMCAEVAINTKDIEHVKRIVLPIQQYQYIATTPRATISDTTILKFFQAARPEIEVTSWERLSTAGSGATTRAVGYDPDRLNVRMLMSVMFEQQAPQLKNMAYVVNCRFKTGGVISPFPKSVIYMDDI